MLNESAPAWLRIACVTDAFSPWMSDTTAMIDVTATMLPSTVISDRSLAPQMALERDAGRLEELVHGFFERLSGAFTVAAASCPP